MQQDSKDSKGLEEVMGEQVRNTVEVAENRRWTRKDNILTSDCTRFCTATPSSFINKPTNPH